MINPNDQLGSGEDQVSIPDIGAFDPEDEPRLKPKFIGESFIWMEEGNDQAHFHAQIQISSEWGAGQ